MEQRLVANVFQRFNRLQGKYWEVFIPLTFITLFWNILGMWPFPEVGVHKLNVFTSSRLSCDLARDLRAGPSGTLLHRSS